MYTYANSHSDTYFISVKNLSANDDKLHFNALSLRKFGIRYYRALKKINSIEPLQMKLTIGIYIQPPLKELAFVAEVKFAGKITLAIPAAGASDIPNALIHIAHGTVIRRKI
jgi:hypothetical protein